MSASYGCAEFSFEGDTVPDLLAAADAALYRAKSLGRDCVVGADRPTLAREAE